LFDRKASTSFSVAYAVVDGCERSLVFVVHNRVFRSGFFNLGYALILLAEQLLRKLFAG
jgi:hypothetical protein